MHEESTKLLREMLLTLNGVRNLSRPELIEYINVILFKAKKGKLQNATEVSQSRKNTLTKSLLTTLLITVRKIKIECLVVCVQDIL